MIPGGIADKLGNRYEAKWLVRCLLDVVAGKAGWLKFESLESDYQGFEFALQRGITTEWYQTKVNAPKGNWTINALKNEGVLAAFKNRLSACEKAHCFFVSQDNSKALRMLSDKARMANDFSEYTSALAKDQKEQFEQLVSAWDCNEETGFIWLKRTHVDPCSERQLESLLESFGDLYFLQSGKSIFPALREILETHFNQKITVEVVREAIKSQGILTIKEWSLDPTIPIRLGEETEAYLQTYSPFGAGGETIHRKQTAEVIEEISRSNGGNLILLTGVAGSGKSGVIRAVIENLGQRTIPHLAFRIDHFLSCATREELGTKLTGRQESPVSTLKGISPTETAVLIIDQVDAVSEVSGRDGRVREVIFRMIEDSKNFGGIRVIVACRTFDLESDSRLKSLKEANQSKQIDVPTLNWDTEVLPVLKSKGIKTSGLSESKKNLLCLPVNLAVFLEIGEGEFSFQSRSALFEKLIEKKQRVIANGQKPSWALIDPLAKLGEWMSNRQQLKAPAATLDSFPCAIDILTSEGLIVFSREQINFFHESFFDYIYARSFLNNNQSLMDLLTSTEQHLFRRTQVRQILDVLRQGDFDRYLNELTFILSSDQIRFHIKSSVSKWLSSIEEPTLQEFEIISSLDNPMEPFNQLVRNSLLSTHLWFDLLNDKEWVQAQLLSSQQIMRREPILWWLSQIAGERPDDIACLLRKWWGNIPERGERLLSWVGHMKRNKDDQSLLNLCNDIIKSHQQKIPFSEEGRNSLSMLLHTLWTKNSKSNGEILHSIFNNWFEMNPGQTPFERDVIKDGELYALSEFAKRDPQAFLAGTTNALIKSIDIVLSKGPTSQTWYYFKNRTYSGHRFGFDEFLGMFRTALQTIAQINPEKATEYLEKLDFNKHECLMHLHLEAIQANPQALSTHLLTLIVNPMAFEAGYKGADWFSIANVTRAALPHLNQQERLNVEHVIFSYHPEIDQAKELYSCVLRGEASHQFCTYSSKDVIRVLNRSGYTERCILETIGETNLSVNGRARLGELRRKFPTFYIETPTNVKAGMVGSPIKPGNCERMNDKNWLSAIKYYNGEETPKERRKNFFVGGARELAGELQKATKRDPERFSSLAMSIPFTAHNSYIKHILWGLAESEEVSEMCLSKAIRRAHSHPDKPFGEEIARLIETHPEIAQDTEILEILLWYARHCQANLDDTVDEQNCLEERITIKELLEEGQSFRLKGKNGTRGLAWEALGSVLWKVPSAKNRIWDILEHALGQEDRISVRCCMMKPLTPLFNDDKNRFTHAIQNVVILPESSSNAQKPIRLSPLITYEGINLFPYILYHMPELGDKLISDLLNSGDPNMELVGAWLIFCESYRNDAYIDRADALTYQSLDHRRLMADVSADALKGTEYRNRAEKLVEVFFFDEDEQARKLAARVFREISPDEVENYRNLAKNFLNSPAFTENSHVIFRMLENATCDILDLVLEASSQIIEDIATKGDQHGPRSLDLHELQDLLKKEYAASEGKPEARKKILDLIDLMLYHELYGVDTILNAHER